MSRFSRFQLGIALLVSLLIMIPTVNGIIDIQGSVQTEDPDYDPGELVNVTIRTEIMNVITLQVKDPDGNIIFIKSITSSNEDVVLEFRLPHNSSKGRYRFYVTIYDPEHDEYTLQTGSFQVSEGEGIVLFVPIPVIVITVVCFGSFSMVWLSDKGRFYFLLMFVVPLYSRLKSGIENDLEQRNNRGRIYQHIKENPGTSLSNIKDAVETGNGTTVYHLNVLEKEGLVAKKGIYYFIKGDQISLFAQMNRNFNPKESSIIAYLMVRDFTNERNMIEALGERQSTINRILKTLMRFEIVTRTKYQGIYHYTITNNFKEWLKKQDDYSGTSDKFACPSCRRVIPIGGAEYCPYCSKRLEPKTLT